MFRHTSPLTLFLVLLLFIAGLVSLGPPERTLGVNVRLVYLHGAWVWTALISFSASALFGVAGLATGQTRLQQWSVALGQAGIFFWVTYLPLSLWTMMANWNGLYLTEPRWRIAVDFAIIGLLLQGAIVLFKRPDWASAINTIYLATLLASLTQAEQVMHPSSPILASNSLSIRFFFGGLVAICLTTAWQLTRWLRSRSWPI
jgi:hypothetical protein